MWISLWTETVGVTVRQVSGGGLGSRKMLYAFCHRFICETHARTMAGAALLMPMLALALQSVAPLR